MLFPGLSSSFTLIYGSDRSHIYMLLSIFTPFSAVEITAARFIPFQALVASTNSFHNAAIIILFLSLFLLFRSLLPPPPPYGLISASCLILPLSLSSKGILTSVTDYSSLTTRRSCVVWRLDGKCHPRSAFTARLNSTEGRGSS